MDNLNGKDINDVKKIVVCDYSDYDPRFCRNGGKYGYWTNYIRNGVDNWEVTYETTSDFDYCPCCGQFANHYDCEEGEYTCGGHEIMTDDAILKLLNGLNEEDDFRVEFTS